MNLVDLVKAFTPDQMEQARALEKEIDAALGEQLWFPNPGPQTEAYFSAADELFYGGAAGGGKTDLLIGLATTQHHRSLILRREGTDLGAIEERLVEVVGPEHYAKSPKKIARRQGRRVELGSCPHDKDRFGYQGQPHDLKAFDEITQFSQEQYRYIIGWNRPMRGREDQRCRVVCTGNPPSTPEGEWVKRYWGPWLDPQHPNPAAPGDLRWFTTIDDEDVEVDADWRGVDDEGNELRPKSRTFIPARLSDNPYLGAEYRATIAAMPEPYRSQLLRGDFHANVQDDPFQIIPTEWVLRAFDRYEKRAAQRESGQSRRWVMTSLGCDPALRGKDSFVLAPVYDNVTCGPLIVTPGAEITDGAVGAALIVQHYRDHARLVVDMGGGYGDAVWTHIADKLPVKPTAYIGGAANVERALQSGLRFANHRTAKLWRLREMLDPDNLEQLGYDIALYPDDRLKADLVAPTYSVRGDTIHAEPKEKLIARIGRSPDRGDAVVMAFSAAPVTVEEIEGRAHRRAAGGRRHVNLGYAKAKVK